MAQQEKDVKETRRSAFLNEGVTKAAIWPGTDSLAPITITYRPLSAIESGAYLRDMARSTGPGNVVELKMAITKMLAKQIVGWDLRDERGEPVGISEEILLRHLDDLAVTGLQKLVEDSTETLEEAAGN